MKYLLNDIKHSFLFIYSLISLFFKTVLFIIVLPSPSSSKLDPVHAYTSAPPFLIYIFFIIIFLSFSFLFKNRAHMWYLILINLLLSILLICDLWYYRGFSDVLTPYLLKESGNLDNLYSSVLSMGRFIDIFFIADVILMLTLALIKREIYSNFNRNAAACMILLGLSISYICYDHLRVDVYKKGITRSMLFRRSWSLVQTISNLGPFGYHLYNAYSFIKDSKPYTISNNEAYKIDDWFERKQENLPDNSYKGLFKGKNLLIVQIESLEKFIINQRVNNQEITPNINKLLKNGIYFTNYNEQVYNGTSSDADFLTNTSLYPIRSGSTFFRFPYNSYNSLPKMLKAMGYYTTAIHPEKGSYWNWLPALKNIGFDRCIDSTCYNIDEFIGLGISDGSYLMQVEPIIGNMKQPFYTFMVTLTSHGPFKLPQKYKTLKLEKNLNSTKLGAYFQALHYTDKQIGNFISRLNKDGLLENTVIVLYGDHCGIHKFYQDEVNKIKPSETWWMDNHRNIPLIIYSKGMKPEIKEVIGGQIDLLPTIAYLMGVNPVEYNKTALGRNLLNTKRSFAVWSNKTYIGKATTYKNDAIEGITISDEIIRSNYFKNKY